MAKWPDLQVCDEEYQYKYSCCRSTHVVELRRRGAIWFAKHQKTTIHRRTHTTIHRLGPRKETDHREIIYWVHEKTCPNKGWCEFYKKDGIELTTTLRRLYKVA